jgi:hypothetical protein
MSLNIKDAYNDLISKYRFGNNLPTAFGPSEKYYALPFFKRILDEYAKEKLEAFIDDHFPENSLSYKTGIPVPTPSVTVSSTPSINKSTTTSRDPVNLLFSNPTNENIKYWFENYKISLPDAISAAKEHYENNKIPGVPDAFNSLYHGSKEALNNFRKFSEEQEKSSDLGKSGGRQGTQEQWDNVNKEEDTKMSYKQYPFKLYEIKYHITYAVWDQKVASTVALNEHEALTNFWKGKNKDSYEIMSVRLVETIKD